MRGTVRMTRVFQDGPLPPPLTCSRTTSRAASIHRAGGCRYSGRARGHWTSRARDVPILDGDSLDGAACRPCAAR